MKRITLQNPLRKREYKHLHQIPGEVTYVGHREAKESVEIIHYDASEFTRIESDNLEDAFPFKEKKGISWINVNGLSAVRKIESLGRYFNIRPLLVEDLVNTYHRPKFEEFDEGIIFILKLIAYGDEGRLIKEHIGIVLGKSYVVTFRDGDSPIFEKLKKRIESNEGRVRKTGSDYLMYIILDYIIDEYFIVSDIIIDKAEVLESELFKKKPHEDVVTEIQLLKHEVIKIYKAVQPLREMMKQLDNTINPLINKKTRSYLRDLSDHIIHVSENINIYREIVWGLMELYLATINSRMNEIMKVLTIIASIFIPLSFIAGVYGMNFVNMPELNWKYGYFIVLGFMLLVLVAMLYYFRNKRWL